MIEYACGCIRNKVVCAKAERLWDRVADAHNRLVRRSRGLGRPGEQAQLQDAYNRALQAYERHFSEPVKKVTDQKVLPLEEG